MSSRAPLAESVGGKNSARPRRQHVYGKRAKADSATALLASFKELSLSDTTISARDKEQSSLPHQHNTLEQENKVSTTDNQNNTKDVTSQSQPQLSVDTANSIQQEAPDALLLSGDEVKEEPCFTQKRSRRLPRDTCRNKAGIESSALRPSSPNITSDSTAQKGHTEKGTTPTAASQSSANFEKLPIPKYLKSLVQLSNTGFQSSASFGKGFPKNLFFSQIASGSFGEVFVLTKSKRSKRPIRWVESDVCAVFKVIPLNAEKGKGSRKYSRVDDVVSEVRVSLRMDEVSGFLRFRDVHVVKGQFPESLEEAAQEYRESLEGSEAPDWRSFPQDQVFAIIEMDYAGRQLESVLKERPSIQLIYDTFWLVTCTLALGERIAQFEHRDLHISNICIRSRHSSSQLHPPGPGNAFFGASGAGITIIDFTYSRTALTEDFDNKTGIAATEMKDLWFRKRKASSSQECLQNKAYEEMLDHIESAAANTKPSQRWKCFMPGTNYIWLRYLLSSLLSSVEVPSEKDVDRELYTRLKKCLCELDELEQSRSFLERGAMGVVESAEASGWIGNGDMAMIEEVMNNDI
ncbi:MAG: hypothetical protein Q9227_003144 [Pyrenula ochraceoflavens]